MKIYIIGTGIMGSAIAERLAAIKKYKVVVAGRDAKKNRYLARYHTCTIDHGYAQLRFADLIIIAVKPQNVAEVAKEIHEKISKHAVIVSIAAGLSIARLKALLGHVQIVRAMPNLGITVGQGIVGWVKGLSVTQANHALTEHVLGELAEAIEFTNEIMLNKVTTISGCGPAYFFYIAEAMVQAGLDMGLAEKVCRQLVQKTLATAAALQSQHKYPELIARVASKKGVTEVALKEFSKKKLAAIIATGMRAALRRTKELSQG